MPQSGQFAYQEFLTPDPTTWFQENVSKFIPAMYKTGEFDGTEELFNIFAPLFDEMYQRAIELPKLVDIDRCPAKFLQILAGNINTLTVEDTFNEYQNVRFRRRELGKMVDIFKIRSVFDSFIRILKYQEGTDYGLIIPRENLMFVGVTPIGGAPDGEVNDVEELLAPEYFDISDLADGGYDGDGNLQGNKIAYALPKTVVRSEVKLWWNDHEVPLSHQDLPGEIERSFFFDIVNSTITTNFIPLLGDVVVVEVVGDPYYQQSYRMVDRWYWRPGTEEAYSDANPILRVEALMDRRPAGTILYFAWLLKFFWTKCFPFPPAIDYQRAGYEGVLPPHQAATWDPEMDCASPDPWFFNILQDLTHHASYEERAMLQNPNFIPFTGSYEERAQITIEQGSDTFME